MKNRYLFTGLMAILVVMSTMTVQAGIKVKICHIPPDDPDNFHTITVSEKALPAHLAHGDSAGSCSEIADILCDDGNACTRDEMDPVTETCLAEHLPVNCDDSNLCTVDSCDPAAGCVSATIDCDDGNLCTTDECVGPTGLCANVQRDCPLFGTCIPETGLCADACDGFVCEPINQCHTAGFCSVDTNGIPYCGGVTPTPGVPCDDGNPSTTNDTCDESGTCVGQAASVCPCWDAAQLDAVRTATLNAEYACHNIVEDVGFGANIMLDPNNPWFPIHFPFTIWMDAARGYCEARVPDLGIYNSHSGLTPDVASRCRSDVVDAGLALGISCF